MINPASAFFMLFFFIISTLVNMKKKAATAIVTIPSTFEMLYGSSFHGKMIWKNWLIVEKPTCDSFGPIGATSNLFTVIVKAANTRNNIIGYKKFDLIIFS